MPTFVYALHDFVPEKDDEVGFRAGEQIEVIEKDDEYGDGWWQGRNSFGKVGLFPQAYTTSDVPDNIGVASSGPGTTTATPKAQTPSAPMIHLNGQEAKDGEVMQATMTDVQQAIEQLGQRRGDEDRSFSFASSRKGPDTERDTDTDGDADLSDAGESADEEGQGWHKKARTKLAEKARQAIADAERLEMIGRTQNSRSYAPPIAVELSDESDDGEDDGDHYPTSASSYPRRHSLIPEESEEDLLSRLMVPDAAHTDRASEYSGVASEVDEPHTATVGSFPTPRRQSSLLEDDVVARAASVYLPSSPEPTALESRRASANLKDTTSSSPTHSSEFLIQQMTRPRPGGPVPIPRSATSSTPSLPPAHITPTSHSTLLSSRPNSPPPLKSPNEASFSTATSSTLASKEKATHPSEWSVSEVVDWLSSKGFDQEVCDKFVEQEISGDVLLDLDVNMLKSEIGIMAFGKRMRIANYITELRRPPSVTYSDQPEPSPASASMATPQSARLFDSPMSYQHSPTGHSRNVSQSQSHNSYPGSYKGSISGINTLLSPESVTADLPASPVTSNLADSTYGESHGLGISSSTQTIMASKRPSQLSLSPSDGAIGQSVKAVSGIPEEGEDDRAAMSDGDTRKGTMRRVFGRDSTGHSTKDSVSPTSRSFSEKEKKDKDRASTKSSDKEKEKGGDKDTTVRHARSKRSVDAGGKPSERLSLFGGSFSSGIGKHRKPAPKYSSEENDLKDKDGKGSGFHMPKLTTASRKSVGRASIGMVSNAKADSTVKPRDKDARPTHSRENSVEGEKSPALLRKRTSSYPGPAAPAEPPNHPSPLKPGQNIFDQIGDPDHKGWMRKRGERITSWKLRFFLLKGPHLYILKSDSPSQTKIKGYVNINGYRVTVDENLNPGKYGFRIEHERDRMHFFSSDDKMVIREWMKAIMKATIARDYNQPVISSVNIPTIPLMVAQAMNPAPRPPSPTQRDATQRALRRDNPNQLSSRDARVLMGLPSGSESKDERARVNTFFTDQPEPATPMGLSGPSTPKAASTAPPRPERRKSEAVFPVDDDLVRWANDHLPENLHIKDTSGSICGALELLRIAESVKGRPCQPPVLDSAFPSGPNDEKLEGLFKLFDFLLDNEVKMGSISINDIRQGNREKIIQLLKALRTWEDKRKALAAGMAKGTVHAANFIAPTGTPWSAM
ncbi:hypothetical protein CYLTODRAFT_421620 [Cylindrobasidium torrendii FP15055 ss-10]|uniref:PH-domain-containing protein n=1 Tax=Cylindrobasidium torrendii FP15055 ss-10 TaxID=1314674 RepID=A0A0D7BDX9_9AGAR|nr:hypothetical protein CYLTODRAFT_421620 [Cylindrobasidium torrendii FP15055 ss-10]